MRIEVTPVTAVRPVLVGHTRRAKALVRGQGDDAPVSPVVMQPFDFGVALAHQQGDVRLIGHQVRSGGVAIVNLLQHLVAGSCAQGEDKDN